MTFRDHDRESVVPRRGRRAVTLTMGACVMSAWVIGSLGTPTVGPQSLDPVGLIAPSRVHARCAVIPLETEIARARYVVEARVTSVQAHSATLEVLASWKGRAPRTLSLGFSGRSHPLRRVGDRPVVAFVMGHRDDQLTLYPCGATGAVEDSLLEALVAAGLRRTTL